VCTEAEKPLTYPSIMARYVGDNVRIGCNILDGVWSKNNEPLPPFFEIVGSDLLLVDVRPEHTGNYICRSNSDPSIMGNTNVFIGGEKAETSCQKESSIFHPKSKEVKYLLNNFWAVL